MHLIMTTFAFLMIFSIFSFAQLQKLKENYTAESVYTGCFEKTIDDLSDRISKKAARAFHTLCPDKPKQERGKKLISFLHISSLIQPDALPQQSAESKAAKALLKRLILTLYGDKTFFLEAGMDEATVENLIATLFLNAKDLPIKNFLKSPRALANVPLNNKTYEGVLYKMLKGNTPPKNDSDVPFANPENYKSLANFIRFQKKASIISVYLAPDEVLIALFQNLALVNEVIEIRNKIYKEQLKEKNEKKKNKNSDPQTVPVQNTDLDEYKKKFENYRESIADDIDKNLIDFNISLSDPEDYTRDT